LDTWTLLTWVASRTDRIRLAGNVLNVPMRPPAVLARAAVSLDQLSGGRFDLALGAGGFWDAIEAMGGRRLTPGQAVQALEEAIDIIHGIWDVEDREPLRVPGEFHHVNGAKRGPAPAHRIPIWIGAYRPRMQRLIGRKADGWLPSLGRLERGALSAGNRTIDEAAVAVGRDPRDIRTILNVSGEIAAVTTDSTDTSSTLHGPSAHWVQVLGHLALQDGIDTFVLFSDDPRTLEQFAGEVIPALLDAVAQQR
jgi:alkanesulfonate monooxygenase SsuD/methylene tetrahydromethanopterin reductase-like flavin-dependent oxidoreductase (luciferase family)